VSYELAYPTCCRNETDNPEQFLPVWGFF